MSEPAILIALGAVMINGLGYVVLAFKFEHRMTKIETHLSHLLLVMPKRRGDEEGERG